MIIPRADTPSINDQNWYGTAHLRTISEQRVDIYGWSEFLADDTPHNVAAAILLSEPMPFEFPSNLGNLFSEILARGVPLRFLLLTLQVAILHNGEGDPLYVIIGAPMRGIKGSGEIKQHLTAWYISPEMALHLRLALKLPSDEPETKEIKERLETAILNAANKAAVEWCRVREAREEITVRRDFESPMNWFEGKTVALWGCGALGGHVAESLTRAGIKKLILRDSGTVAPGILVRQPFDDIDIGRPKVEALAERLSRIRPDLDISSFTDNILTDPLDGMDITDGADVVIDTTAAEPVLAKLEFRRRSCKVRTAPIVSMAIGHTAERGLLAIAGPAYSGGPFDVVRRAKLEACNRANLSSFADEFWPLRDGKRRQIFQPEPGCSESTFTGSDADLASLSATMLNLTAKELAEMDGDAALAHLITQPHAKTCANETIHSRLSFRSDLINQDPHTGYEIRIAESAWNDMKAWIEKSSRARGAGVETGGLLFGERDDATRIIWISEIIGPPPDSLASESHFDCGVDGTTDINDEKKLRSRDSVQYVGMWHSHPGSSPVFSGTDFEGMRQLIEEAALSPSKLLLLIVGTPESDPTVGTYVFKRSDFANLRRRDYRLITSSSHSPAGGDNRIGLSLSGGGSRAIAFHLGCLRALHDRGILSQVKVMSSVSGGSVIAAMYAYSEGDFEDFDARVWELLRRGLSKSILFSALFSPLLLGSICTNLVAGTSAITADILRSVFSTGSRLLDIEEELSAKLRNKLHAPFLGGSV
jgi:integrative and conjugative element protein (TIGR02256 family)